MDFAKQVRQAIEQLLMDGFRPPFLMVQVGRNGAMLYHRFIVREDPLQGIGFDAERLAMYPQDEEAEIKTPINQLWVDARGATRHVKIEATGENIAFSAN